MPENPNMTYRLFVQFEEKVHVLRTPVETEVGYSEGIRMPAKQGPPFVLGQCLYMTDSASHRHRFEVPQIRPAYRSKSAACRPRHDRTGHWARPLHLEARKSQTPKRPKRTPIRTEVRSGRR